MIEENRFWGNVLIDESLMLCWPWIGAKSKKGYGRYWTRTDDGKTFGERSHRAAYKLARGPIPDGLVIDHLCRNRGCCNPWHMETVTISENTERGENRKVLRLLCLARRSRGQRDTSREAGSGTVKTGNLR